MNLPKVRLLTLQGSVDPILSANGSIKKASTFDLRRCYTRDSLMLQRDLTHRPSPRGASFCESNVTLPGEAPKNVQMLESSTLDAGAKIRSKPTE